MGIMGDGTDALLRDCSNTGSSLSMDVLGSGTLLRLADDCIEWKSSLHSSDRMLLVRIRHVWFVWLVSQLRTSALHNSTCMVVMSSSNKLA